MNQRVNSKISIVVYAICDLFFVILIFSFLNFFRKSPISLTLAGFLGSLLFFFLVATIGMIFEINKIKRKPGFIPITFSLIISNSICLYVHPYCLLSCFSFCIPIGIYLLYSSKLMMPQPHKVKLE